MGLLKNNRAVQKVVDYIGRRRALRIVGSFERFLSENETVLDIGAGGGWNGKRIQEQKKGMVTLVDVINLNQTDLPLQTYDGRRIPFDDNSFDTALLLFVLHHCEDPGAVLKEAIRVSKKRIVILEDTFATALERATLCLHDTFSNSPAFLVESCGMNLPYNFKKKQDWEASFLDLGLNVVHARHIQRFPITQTLFVLEKR